HTAILGRTLGAIAFEKAGILRRERQALLAQQRPAAARALARACRAVSASCRVVAPEPRELPLAGEHQRQNAALAVVAARTLLPGLDEGFVDSGLARVKWPGRFELVGQRPQVVLDGAHNGASAEALARTLNCHAAGRPLTLVTGINRDKDARALLRPLVPLADLVVTTQATRNPRALTSQELARL